MNIKVKTWYSQYFAQTWYRNSFLVNHPNQIAKALSPPHEWNSINDSGCNITCLAMIIGVDPAHFVSELCRKKFFERDFKRDNGKELRAKHLNNRKIRGFVWDKNKPHKRKPQLIIERVWHPIFNRTTRITIRFHKEIETKDYQEAKEIIRSARKKNLHVICGPCYLQRFSDGNLEDFFDRYRDRTMGILQKGYRGTSRFSPR
jgi:hypothetical protein